MNDQRERKPTRRGRDDALTSKRHRLDTLERDASRCKHELKELERTLDELFERGERIVRLVEAKAGRNPGGLNDTGMMIALMRLEDATLAMWSELRDGYERDERFEEWVMELVGAIGRRYAPAGWEQAMEIEYPDDDG